MPRVVTPRVNPRFSTTRPAEAGEQETVAVLLERVAAIVFEAVAKKPSPENSPLE